MEPTAPTETFEVRTYTPGEGYAYEPAVDLESAKVRARELVTSDITVTVVVYEDGSYPRDAVYVTQDLDGEIHMSGT